MATKEQSKEWYKKWWGMAIAIITLPLFIIWYAWFKSKWDKVAKVIVTIMVSVFMLGAMASDTAPAPSGQPAKSNTQQKQEPSKPQPKAAYEASITSYAAINPASLRFTAEVKNIGDAEGKFECTVRGKDASSTYTGFDFFEDQGGTLKPGETRTFNGVITIKKEGALFVTSVTISC